MAITTQKIWETTKGQKVMTVPKKICDILNIQGGDYIEVNFIKIYKTLKKPNPKKIKKIQKQKQEKTYQIK